MCTPECRCYSGDNNETRELWSGYDEELILPFKRNNIDKTTFDAGNNEIYPLAWTDDKEVAISSFKECFEKVLLPRQSYNKV